MKRIDRKAIAEMQARAIAQARAMADGKVTTQAWNKGDKRNGNATAIAVDLTMAENMQACMSRMHAIAAEYGFEIDELKLVQAS